MDIFYLLLPTHKYHEMFYKQIENKRNQWIASPECTVNGILSYIESKGMLRDAQIDAVKTYLFLKVACCNQPLWSLFASGFFNTVNIDDLEISNNARSNLSKDTALLSLFEYACEIKDNGEVNAPTLKKAIIKGEVTDSINIIKKLFYDVSYTDYLFSLPMGAGKTWLMATFIYLDLYLAINEPDNKSFAHNFIVFAPSGLKSSVVPSLKTIRNFDPSWIIPEPSATQIKKIIKFELLDEQRSQNKSNRTKNPNAQKLNNHQPIESLFGLVAVTNAEKVIIDRLKIENGRLFELSDDDKDRQANELRNLIGKIPNLSVFIDEVHHAMDDDIKLRGVVNKWMENDTVNSVIGFSGTPYLEKAEGIDITENLRIKNTELSNVVNYYALLKGIGNFLKKPEVHISENPDSLKIVEQGVREFLDKYQNTNFPNGCTTKLAIYCGTIERLESQIYPLVAEILSEYNLHRDTILRFHKGNTLYAGGVDWQLEFDSLDTSLSKIRIILLVQIGKEGWDCKSLSGIVLSQEGDCPKNMVLQTSCRCLRQVVRGKTEPADIWLNSHNAKVLNEQLQKQQHITLEQFNSINNQNTVNINRYSRMDILKLPPIEFYQLRLEFVSTEEVVSDIKEELTKVLSEETYCKNVLQIQDFKGNVIEMKLEGEQGDEAINFNQWLYLITKESLGTIGFDTLNQHLPELKHIYTQISYEEANSRYLSSRFQQELIRSKIRQTFAIRHLVATKIEPLQHNTKLLKIDSLISPIESAEPEKYYPNPTIVERIIKADNNDIVMDEETLSLIIQLEKKGKDNLAQELRAEFELPTHINNTYHYLPYNFSSSSFEQTVFKEMLTIPSINSNGLEIYYNGDRSLTEFKIKCYKKDTRNAWRYIGEYTPDFLIINRDGSKIYKVAIIETKGEGYSNDPKFHDRKKFVEGEFLNFNNAQFGYKRFEYMYLEDTENQAQRLSKIETIVKNFFNQ